MPVAQLFTKPADYLSLWVRNTYSRPSTTISYMKKCSMCGGTGHGR
jgi:hypothetical protein